MTQDGRAPGAKPGQQGLTTVEGGPDRRERRYRTPALFISHGSPLAVLDEGFALSLRQFGARLRPPRAVAIVSAHWEAVRPIRVTASRTPSIERNAEFPSWLETKTYKCPGSPDLAADIVHELSAAGLPAMLDMTQGLDDAAWMPMSLLFPNARVPIVQVSIPTPSTPELMRGMGRALASLRYKGVLLVGSGGIVHNESRARFDQRDVPTEAWAIAFDAWVRDRLEAMEIETLQEYRTKGPHAYLASPTAEHLDPLFFVLGCIEPGDRLHHLFEGFHAGILSLRCFVLAGRRKEDLRLHDTMTLPRNQPVR